MAPLANSIVRSLPGLAPLFDESPTATPPVTATVAVEATATPVPAPTPAPALPSPWAPSEWLKATGWTVDFHTPFLVLFLFIAIAAVVVYFYFFQRRFKDHKLHARLAERTSMILTSFATVGLLLLVFAMGKIPLLSAPLWLILTMIAFIAFGVYAVYYYATIYPSALAKHNREQERARYIPKPKTKGPAKTPPMKKVKKKQKRK
jgi:hypothetical protein